MSRWVKAVSFSRDGLHVRFEPCSAPPFTHRVLVIVGTTVVAKDWLGSTFRVNAKTAQFFADKHVKPCADGATCPDAALHARRVVPEASDLTTRRLAGDPKEGK